MTGYFQLCCVFHWYFCDHVFTHLFKIGISPNSPTFKFPKCSGILKDLWDTWFLRCYQVWFHTSFRGPKLRLGNYLFKFFWITLYSQYLLRCIIYYLLRYYKEPDTASGTVLQKSCSKICRLNRRSMYLQRVSKNSFLKLNFLKDIFQGFWSQLLQWYFEICSQLNTFSIKAVFVSTKSEVFLKHFFSIF